MMIFRPTVPASLAWRQWVSSRIPELAVVLLGLVLRVSLKSFDVTLGYDFPTHQQYVSYLAQHHALPPYDLNVSAYNPALYYALAAVLMKAGCSFQALRWISIAASSVTLLLVWLGLELYLEKSRLARLLALCIAAVVPASLHVAGMMANHALSDTFCVAAMVLLPQVLRRRGRAAYRYGAAAGACLGLALLTKISGAVVLAALLAAVAVAIARAPAGADVARRLLPGVAVVLAVTFAISGWHYVRHRVLYGKFVLVGYDQFVEVDPVFRIPYLDRRTFGFVGYWDDAIYDQPFWPSGIQPHSRFWPVLVATTFSDYYNFAFVAPPKPGVPAVVINRRPMAASAILPARLSVMGGTALAFLAAAAWFVAARRLWRRGDDGRLVLLLAGGLAILGQLHFAIRFPTDTVGPVKGAYLQFAAPVLSALTGIAIAWLWARRGLARVLALGAMVAIAMVASYPIYARLIAPLAG
jgi:4-amino-4-deoxy-L-arabinose transferase-like glycosyltransferase